MFWQYKFHWDAELTHHNLDNDMARYVTALLYLTDVEAGGASVTACPYGMADGACGTRRGFPDGGGGEGQSCGCC